MPIASAAPSNTSVSQAGVQGHKTGLPLAPAQHQGSLAAQRCWQQGVAQARRGEL